jgi:hypothetical protein
MLSVPPERLIVAGSVEVLKLPVPPVKFSVSSVVEPLKELVPPPMRVVGTL